MANHINHFFDRVHDFGKDVSDTVSDVVHHDDRRIGRVTTWKIISIIGLIVGIALATFSQFIIWLLIPSVILITLSAILLSDTCKVSDRLDGFGAAKKIVDNKLFLKLLADDTIFLKYLIK